MITSSGQAPSTNSGLLSLSNLLQKAKAKFSFFHPIKDQRSFTLVELLIVIGILAVISTAAVMVINPVDMLKQSKDSNRMTDLQTINKALSILETQGVSNFGSSNTV
ncbi:type II secretion system protein, partial [Candidatus Wolfebacteria bacterium]|nr:type II secretion system protein [Candidatus Wolfebacteria bacterium]